MLEDKRILHSTLETARQELRSAQARVADLEAQLSEGQPLSLPLLETDDRYRRTLDNMREGCQIIGFDWRYLYVNDAAVHYARQSKEALLGHTLMERYPGIESTEMFAVFQRCLKERVVEAAEFELSYSDGSTAWFEFRIQPVPEGIFVLILDISSRKRAEEPLLRSEERFRGLFETMTEGVAIHKLIRDKHGTPQDYVILDVNPAYVSQTGISAETAIGKPASELYGTQPPPYLELYQTVVTTDQPGHFDTYFPPMEKFFSISIFSTGKDGFATVFEDITERKRAEENIRKLNRTLAVLSDINQVIVRVRHVPSLLQQACQIAVEKGSFRKAWVGLLDPATERIQVVAQSDEIAGVPQEPVIILSGELAGSSAEARALRAGQHVVYNDLAHDLRTTPWHDVALRLGYRASAAFPLTVAGDVRGTFNLYAGETDFFDAAELRLLDEMASDISFAMEFAEQEEQRQRAQNALRASEEQYRSLIESSDSVIALFDANGVLHFANQIAADSFLLTPDMLVGKHMSDLFPPPVAQGHLEAVQQVIRTGEGIASETSSSVLGEERWYRNSVQPVRDAAGNVTLALVNATDITPFKQAEAALQRYAQRMEMLHAIDLGLIQGGSIQAVVDATLKHLRKLIPCQRASVILFDWDTDEGIVFADDSSQPYSLGREFRASISFGWNEGAGIPSARILSDLRLIENPLPVYKQLIRDGLVSGIQAYFLESGQPTGLLGLNADRPDFFTQDHLDIATEVASQLSIAIHQMHLSEALASHAALLEQRVEERTAQLQAAKEQVEAILNNSVDGILLVTPDLHIRQTNTVFNRLLACDSDDYFDQPLSVLADTDDVDRLTETLEACLAEQEEAAIEMRARRKDGSAFEAELSIGYVKDDGLVCTLRDITERKIRERQLRYYASMQESVSEAVMTMDLQYGIQSWNQAAEHIYGWKADEVVGKNVLYEILKAPQESETERQSILEAFHQQGNWHGEIVRLRKDGTEVNVLASLTLLKDERCKPFGMVAVHHDITERKAQERQLRYHASLQQNVSDAVIVTDMAFHIQSWNRAAERIYGWRAEEVIDRHITEILIAEEASPGDLERSEQELLEVGWWQGEIIQHHKDGSTRSILASVTVLKDDGGVPIGVIAINHDITERKQVEEALRESEARYRQMFEHNKAVKLVIDPQTGEIVDANAAASAFYGYSPDKLKTMHITDINILASSRLFTEMERASAGSRTVFEFHHRLASGKIRDVEVYSGPVQIQGRLLLHSIVMDITDRKQAEEALQRSAAEIHDLYNNAPCGYHSLDKNGVIIQINDTELRWLGYDREEVVGKLRIADIFTPDSMLTFQKNFPLFKERGWINDLEFDVIRKDGSIMRILLNGVAMYDEDGQYLKSRSSLFDITVLRQAQLALMESEARYRLLAENVTDVLARISPEGIQTFVTLSCYALLGYTPEEMIGQSSFEFMHPEDRPEIQFMTMEALNSSKSSFSFVTRVRHKAGHYVWVEAINSIVRAPDTGISVEIIAVIRDISERKRAEEALNAKLEVEHEFQNYLKGLHEITIELAQLDQLDEFYRRTIELGLQRLGFERLSLFLYDAETNTAIGTYGTDPQGAPVDERDLRFTPGPEGIMGRALRQPQRFYLDEDVRLSGSHEETLGTGWNAAAILWNGTQSLGWLVADNLRSHKPPSKPLLDTLALYALSVGALLARKQADSALRESEVRLRESQQMLRNVLETMPVRVFWKDRNSILLGGNHLYAQDAGFTSSEQLVGKSDFELPWHNHAAKFRASEKAIIESNIPSVQIEDEVPRADGSKVWLQTNKIPLKDSSGEIVGVIGAYVEITKRKQAEEELRRALEQQKELVDLKARFISMASHDFRTPLSVILTSLSLLEMQISRQFGADKLEPLQKRLKRIDESVQHMTMLIDDVLSVNRADTGRMEVHPALLDVESFCKEIVQEIQLTASPQHHLTFSLTGENTRIVVDKQLLRQILVNLLGNAVKYSPGGGEVSLDVRCEPEGAEFRVQDEGIGIPEQDQIHLFETFHRARNVGDSPGTGLGMAITKRAVDALGGTISLESQVGVGTVFLVSLPSEFRND